LEDQQEAVGQHASYTNLAKLLASIPDNYALGHMVAATVLAQMRNMKAHSLLGKGHSTMIYRSAVYYCIGFSVVFWQNPQL